MQYRLQVNRWEILGSLIPLADGTMKVFGGIAHGFGFNGDTAIACLLISAPLLLGVQYRFCYVELTPSTLEYQVAWHARSILYDQIQRVKVTVKSSRWENSTVAEIYPSGAKKLSLKLQRPAEFLAELRQYAYRANWEDAKTA